MQFDYMAEHFNAAPTPYCQRMHTALVDIYCFMHGQADAGMHVPEDST